MGGELETMDLYRVVGKNLRAAREAAHLTQSELSRRVTLGTSQPSRFTATMLSYYETGARRPRLDDLVVLAEALNVSVTYLLTGTALGFAGSASEAALSQAMAVLHPAAQQSIRSFVQHAEALAPVAAMLDAHPRLSALEVLKRLKLTSLPIDLAVIARGLGLHVVPFPFDDAVSGLLIVNGVRRTIGVNTSTGSSQQRQIIAHEIGHFVKGHEVVIDLTPEPGVEEHTASPQREQLAARFAAELLMPDAWLEQDRHSVGLEIYHLADRYHVSPHVMWRRLIDLGWIRT